MISELLLEYKANTGCKSFTIKDVSSYNENLPVTCGQLSITVPGYSRVSYFDVVKGFERTFNMSNLGHHRVSSHGCLNPIPEGNYVIKYSINPNDKLFVEYNFYNICTTEREYFEAVCNYLNERCDMVESEKVIRRKELDDIYDALRFSKISAEECNDIETADELLQVAKDKLEKLKANNCDNC